MNIAGGIKSSGSHEAVINQVSDQQKEVQRTEGARLKAIIDQAKSGSPGLNQTKLAGMLGLKNQSQISHWCRGFVRIPDESLITLAEILGFDPARVRPEIAEHRDE